jgi:hypothetical protein
MRDHHADPVKRRLTIVPVMQKFKPLMQPTTITKNIENQILLFESMGVFVMVYGSTCFK